ncbi:MAG: hypothetical protein RBT41_05545 [Clostridia bacterium]|jgi:hypothetical protein|nr:hypothetical protein [Clostridia bacterium]
MNENQFGVILEDINKKFDFLVEGQKCLEEKFDKRMGNLETKVDKLETKVDQLEIKVDKLGQEMIVIKTFVGRIEDGLNGHEKRIKRLEDAVFVSE